MGPRFRPPKKSDDGQWKKVRFLAEHGFFFQPVYRKDGSIWHRERYPKNMEQAKNFVNELQDRALPTSLRSDELVRTHQEVAVIVNRA